ncbi:hypothetical protein DMUE_1772 [Dictyocoela muelleri]|nr:hypothetical protein DMUE_1772 [Dictyocoela muelleri]
MTTMDYIENLILKKGTKSDKLDMLTLYALRTKDSKYIKELLKYTHKERNDVIFYALSNLIDLIPIAPVFLKQKIIKEFQIQSNNQFISDKVLKLMLNSDLFYEFKDIIINKFGSKNHNIEVKKYILRQCGNQEKNDENIKNKVDNDQKNDNKNDNNNNKDEYKDNNNKDDNNIYINNKKDKINHSLMNLYVKSDNKVRLKILEMFILTHPDKSIIDEILKGYRFCDKKINSTILKLIIKYEIDIKIVYLKVKDSMISLKRGFCEIFDSDGVYYFLYLIRKEQIFVDFFIENIWRIEDIRVVRILYKIINFLKFDENDDKNDKIDEKSGNDYDKNSNIDDKNIQLLNLKMHLKHILFHQKTEILISILALLDFKIDDWDILINHYDYRIRNLALGFKNGGNIKIDNFVLGILERIKLSVDVHE